MHLLLRRALPVVLALAWGPQAFAGGDRVQAQIPAPKSSGAGGAPVGPTAQAQIPAPPASRAPVGATSGDSKRAHATDEGSSRKPLQKIFVDAAASSSAPADGSKQRPYSSLSTALKLKSGAARIQLASGKYEGPFTVPFDVELVGTGGVILVTTGIGPIFTSSGRLQLENVILEGGAVGIESNGSLVLKKVTFRGQQTAGIALKAGASLEGSDCSFVAGAQAEFAIQSNGARVTLRKSQVEGGFRRGIQSLEGTASLTEVDFARTVTAVHHVGGELSLEKVRITAGTGPAVFASRSSLRIRQLSIVDHEYGLQTGTDTVLDVRGLQIRRTERAGLGLVKARGVLEDVEVQENRSFAGLQLMNSTLQLKSVKLIRPSGTGIVIIGGKVELGTVLIEGVTDPDGTSGNGVELRRGELRFDKLEVKGAGGIGLFVSEASTATGTELKVQNARWGAAGVELRSRLELQTLTVRDGGAAGVNVTAPGSIEIASFRADGNLEAAVWANCDQGARVTIGESKGSVTKGLDAPCVTRSKKQ